MPADGNTDEPVALWGLRFAKEGWRSCFWNKRWRSWTTIRQIDLRLCGRGRRFGYRFEIVDNCGRSRLLRFKGGLAIFRKLARILELAQESKARIRIEVFASDILEVAGWDSEGFLSAEKPSAYDLERRARFYLLALEYKLALADARALLERFPHRESVARALIVKSELLNGRMRSARRELKQFVDERGVVDLDAEAEYAIVALYRGRREGERIARRLVDDGKFRCVELVGLEFSRYLADRCRFKEALSVLRVAENRTHLVDVDIFKTLLVARGEVLNKRDYRFYRLVGFLFRTEVKLGVFVALYLAALLWIVLPKSDAFKSIGDRVATRSRVERLGVKGRLVPDSVDIEGSKKGVAHVRFGFYRSGREGGGPENVVFGSSTMFAHEARSFLEHPERGYALYLPSDAKISELAPVSRTRTIVDWYETFDRQGPLAYLLLFGFVVTCFAFARRS